MYKKIILFVIVIVALGCAAYFVFFSKKETDVIDHSAYYAVFLTNGQVYFGNMRSKTVEDIVLINVYYLQLEKDEQTQQETQAQLGQSRFSLVKMGNEIHGPTNEMFINRQNVLFYEKLRTDSKVVASIEEGK